MRVLIFLMMFAFVGCGSTSKVAKSKEKPTLFTPQYLPGPQTLVYKTSKDYSNLVPVILSDDKTKIIAYPHPSDLVVDGSYATPTLLSGGYLLDNRGIGKNVAFLRLNYEEYASLKELPTLEELYSYIIDKNPLTELCNCGNRAAFKDVERELNALIESGELRTTCKVVK